VLRPVRRDGDVRHRRVELLWTRHDAAMLIWAYLKTNLVES
jgi:hypothetical protein